MKNSTFLFIPKSNNFKDIINLNDISNEIKKKGHNCINLTAPISDENLIFLLNEEKIDFVFRINGGKPEKVKKNVKFICWVADIDDLLNLSNFNEDDVIYTLKKNTKEIKKLKIFQMLPAASSFKKVQTLSDVKNLIYNLKSYQNVDISFISNFTRSQLFNGSKKIIYKNAKNNSDKHLKLAKLIGNLGERFSIEYFGLMDYSKQIKNKNIICRGEINNFNFFLEIFRKTKINVLFENEYLDFNTNFFNIFLVEGALVFNNSLNYQINSYLNLDKDIENFSVSFDDIALFKSKIIELYDNFEKRLQLSKKIAHCILKNHTYKNRVEKMLKDLAY